MVAALPANFLQSKMWEDTNRAVGHKTARLGGGETLAIIKSAKRGRYLEIPGGPVADWENPDVVKNTFKEIKDLAKKEHCAFVRVRPQLLNTPENLRLLQSLDLKPSPMHLHAEHTVMIDLKQTEEELLGNMRRQTRYEVRRAEKLNLKVESFSALSPDGEDALLEFYHTQQETASRQHFIPPSYKELKAEFEAFGEDARLYIAKTEEDLPIAYGLFLMSNGEADYFEAASTDLNRKLPGAYALQWRAMRDFKELGLERYNLWGIAPPDQPNHRYAKVTTFKTGFGGALVNFVPAHDLVINKAKYLPDFLIESVRKKARHLS